MTFLGNPDQLIADRYTAVPTKIVEFVGSVAYKNILDVGCGAMMSDFRLVEWGAQHVTGYDIIPAPENYLNNVREQLLNNGFNAPDPHGRLDYAQYDGENFPAADDAFDIVFSWGVFEHVANVPQVLKEMRRVLKPDGVCFISVFPWWPSHYGSHLSDYIDEPYFHLKRSDEWVKSALDDYCALHPDQADLAGRHMWNEYRSLNKISLDEFFSHVVEAGFSVGLSELSSYRQDLRFAPKDRRFTELMACGASVALHKSTAEVSLRRRG